jgi:hypothetical protein
MMRLSAAALALCVAAAQNAPADPRAVVAFGNARFTVLTSALIRLEYNTSQNPTFEEGDAASFVVVNRDLPVPSFSVARGADNVTITTSTLTLTYSPTPPGNGTCGTQRPGIDQSAGQRSR